MRNLNDSAKFVPAVEAPPGHVAGPEQADRSFQNRVIAIAVVFPTLAFIFIGLRLYTSQFILRKFHPDDYIIVIALVFCFGYSIVQFVQVGNGIGLHFWEISQTQLISLNKVAIAANLSYFLATLLVKASVLFFYLRFASGRVCRLAIYGLLIITVGYSLVGAFGFTFLCRPIAKSWDYSIPGECGDTRLWFNMVGGLNSATDVVMLLLPIWILKPLKVSFKQKCAVMIILMAGSFVLAISVLRLVIAIRAKFTNGDLGPFHALNIIWCIVEMGVAIMCACLPCLKPLISRHFPGFLKLNPRRNPAPEGLELAQQTEGYLTAGSQTRQSAVSDAKTVSSTRASSYGR